MGIARPLLGFGRTPLVDWLLNVVRLAEPGSTARREAPPRRERSFVRISEALATAIVFGGKYHRLFSVSEKLLE